jgi:polyhydroxybutyrate depolymerase
VPLPLPLRAPLAALLLAAVSGCTGEAGSPGATAGTDGCAAPTVAAGSYLAASITVAGTERTYRLATPAGDPRKVRALVLVFHGSGGSGDGIRGYLGRPMETSAADEAVFAYPDGLSDGGATGWPDTGGRDVAFVDALLARLAGQLCYDRARVFATGFSYGGYMSNTLGCARAGVVRAIAPLSGGGPWQACNGQPVAAWIAHGTSDPTVALGQGQGSRDQWLGVNGCASSAHATSPSPCVAYDGCGENPVVWCAFPGGHTVESWEPPAVWSFFAGLR